MKSADVFRHPPFKVAWKYFSFTLPQGWEVTRYFDNEVNGFLEFNNEEGPCGRLSWRRVKAVPDVERILAEVHRRHMKSDVQVKMSFERCGIVTLAHTSHGERFYASAFLPATRMMAEWVFPSYSSEKVAEILPTLKKFSENPPNKDNRRIYASFGLECSVPDEFELDSITAKPAAVTFKFLNKQKHRLEVHRWGMAKTCMGEGDVDSFYHNILYSQHCIVKEHKLSSVKGLPCSEITFRIRGKIGFDFLLGSWWRGEGGAVYNEAENRVYACEHMASNRIEAREKFTDVLAPILNRR